MKRWSYAWYKKLSAVRSAMMLSENTNLFQRGWYMKQLEHNKDSVLAYVWFHLRETLDEHGKLHPAKLRPQGIPQTHAHTEHLPLPQRIVCVSHTHPRPLLQLSLRFQMTLLPSLPSTSLTATCLMPTATTTWQVSFKVKCQVRYRIHVFLNYLTCVKPCCWFY